MCINVSRVDPQFKKKTQKTFNTILIFRFSFLVYFGLLLIVWIKKMQ